jgi:prepilin-type N-terminal cleavage/methylation domain-containing protein
VRTERGMTLVELCVSTVIIGILSAGMLSLVALYNKQNIKLVNKIEGVDAARQVIERVGRDFRMARSVGDFYGAVLPSTERIVDPNNVAGGTTTDISVVRSDAIDKASLENGTATLSSDQFPSDGDPFYGPQGTPPAGFTGFPTGGTPAWPAPPYRLGPRTLIVQVPIFDAQGFPIAMQAGAATLECLDTYVYQVLDDPNAPGTCMIQACCFRGGTPATAPPPSRPSGQMDERPRTILKGIVGPRDPGTNAIKVFSYINRATPLAQPSDLVPDTEVPNISGVVVNLEIQKVAAANNTEDQTIGLKSEVFMRNNISATLVAPAQ